MPFKLSNTQASFQGYINKILAEKLNIFVIVYLDDIFIYTKDPGQGHLKVVWWVLDLLKKNDLFANLKMCRFYKDKMQFLGYIVLSQGIRMEDKNINVVKNWPELKSVQDIHVFIGFANFYQRFIWGLSRIAPLFTSMLKTNRSLNLVLRLRTNDDKVIGSGGKTDNRNSSKKSKNLKSGIQTYIKATGEPTFLTSSAKKTLN